MTADFSTWAAQVRRFGEALAALEPKAAEFGVEPNIDAEWRQLLALKLTPQAAANVPLVAAVVGGTNIGKSAVFNQLAGENASAVSPLAAGTKHPVCLAPPDAADEGVLQRLFPGFQLQAWNAAAEALGEADDHYLFWRRCDALPPKLLLLDTPDVDSDAKINWQRADFVRQSADVLIAVVTQQKYNDAAVKKFFRHAAEADKAIILLFNQVDLALDREVWPVWIEVFCRETGARPELVCVAPYDRQASLSLGLKFYAIGADGRSFQESPLDLRRELADLRFDELKTRSLRGALRQVFAAESGLDRYFSDVREAARRFAAARQAIEEAHRVTTSWPGLPANVLVAEIQQWWDRRRGPWSKKIHGAYRSAGQAVLKPLRMLWSGSSQPSDPLEEFRRREQAVIIEGVSRLLDELERLAEVGNDILRPRLRALLGGGARAEYLRRIEAAYASLPPVDEHFRQHIEQELEKLSTGYPRAVSTLRSLDTAAAFARPAVTVSLALTGILLPAGDVLGQTLVHVAGQTAGEIATAVVVAGGGEAAVGAAGTGLKHAAGQLFRRLQVDHARRRAEQLTEIFQREVTR
ncbi:MAG: GTPase domain-containing protein [Pirellulales bacterium]